MNENQEKKLDRLLIGQARQEVRLESLGTRFAEHIGQDDQNFGALRKQHGAIAKSVQRLENSAELQDRFAVKAARRANRTWVIVACMAAVLSAGMAVAQAIW